MDGYCRGDNLTNQQAQALFINLRRACAARVRVVGSVCLPTQHLTYRMFIRPTNDMTYLTANEDQNICGVFSENALLQS